MISTLHKYIGEVILRQARRLIGCFLILLLAHLRNLMLDLLSQSTPPSASPDCTLAHISVN